MFTLLPFTVSAGTEKVVRRACDRLRVPAGADAGRPEEVQAVAGPCSAMITPSPSCMTDGMYQLVPLPATVCMCQPLPPFGCQ